MKTAIVTGATSGIGKSIACTLAKLGYQLILCGRREDRLHKLASELKEAYNTHTICLSFDVRNYQEVKEKLTSLPTKWEDIDLLINNAGLASGLSPIQDGDIEDWEKMIDTNIKGFLYVFRTLAPGFCQRKKGHIINIGSIAGKQVYPNGNVYCATKHAVDALSKGMRIDMLPYGVKVTEVCPGAVETEFSLVRFHGDTEKAAKTYQGYTPLYGDDIAACVEAVLTLPDNICINEFIVMPKAQGDSMNYHKVL